MSAVAAALSTVASKPDPRGSDGPNERQRRLTAHRPASAREVKERSRRDYNKSRTNHDMPTIPNALLDRITIDPQVRFGKPCVRGHRITVQEILEWLSSGASQQQILADYPQLEPEDFLAVYAEIRTSPSTIE